MYRRYAHEIPPGTPIPFKTAKERRALIGKKIGWNDPGWIAARTGTLTGVNGHNVEIGEGCWYWAPSMVNVTLIETSK
jgi:hypothetical protein